MGRYGLATLSRSRILRGGLVAYLVLTSLFYALQMSAANLITPAHVLGASMEPTFQDQDLTFVWRLGYSGRLRPDGGVDYFFSAPKRGDVVAAVVRLPSGERALLTKRIVALAGDQVFIDGGEMYVNGAPTIAGGARPGGVFGPVTIPDQHVFLMGDNRTVSYDSRRFGPVHESALIGPIVPQPRSDVWIIERLRAAVAEGLKAFAVPIRATTIADADLGTR